MHSVESAKRLTALVTQSVQVGSTFGHLVDVIPHDPDGRVDLGLQSCGLRRAFEWTITGMFIVVGPFRVASITGGEGKVKIKIRRSLRETTLSLLLTL